MRMPSFVRRHPWIGLLIVATIGVGSWMLLRAPLVGKIVDRAHPTTVIGFGFSALAIGGMGNWRESVSPRMTALYGLTGLALQVKEGHTRPLPAEMPDEAGPDTRSAARDQDRPALEARIDGEVGHVVHLP